MKIPESWIEKGIIGIQGAIVIGYVWFTLQQDIKQKQKTAKRLQAVHEKEAIRYTKARFKQKRKGLKKRKRK